MIIKIKLVKKCPRGEYGLCTVTGNNSITIEVSEQKNTTPTQFYVTLLHELLHSWLFIMKANGVKIAEKKEHRWIYSVQAVVFKALELLK